MPTLEERLREAENQLLSITRRQYVLEAFVAEWDRVSGKKESAFWGDSAWLMILDFRDMNVVHLASWAKGIYGPSGLLKQVMGNHLRELRLRRPTKDADADREERDPDYADCLDKIHTRSVKRLFPGAQGDFPQPADVQALIDQFEAKMRPVVQDRHENRAHPYEKSGQGRAKMLDNPEMRELFTYAERFMNDLRQLNSQTQLHYHDMNFTSSDVFAEDLVDLLLIGSAPRRQVVMGDPPKDREMFYAALRARHDALDPSAGEKQLWNANYPEDD